MKRRFLLDVMVVMFAIKEVYEGDVPDVTCARLLDTIVENCHSVVADRELARHHEIRYRELLAQPHYQVRTVSLLGNLVYKPEKFVIETAEPPQIPVEAARDIPHEDHYVVRAALISHPLIVTAEKRLLKGINGNSAALGGLKAITPAEALELAKDK